MYIEDVVTSSGLELRRDRVLKCNSAQAPSFIQVVLQTCVM